MVCGELGRSMSFSHSVVIHLLVLIEASVIV